jgi:NAD(P)-dependent dehydrogenase (short-subunit alcohol dehydrogenase family)
MDHIVITGGSKGIGKALALEFLKAGCTVSIAGRNRETLDEAVSELTTLSGNMGCKGFVCDVTSVDDLKLLWEQAAAVNPVNIWINNAGVNHLNHLLHALEPGIISNVIATNIKGTILGSRICIAGMLEQGFGSLFNMEGFGSDGRIMAGMSVYGTSKNATRYFTQSLVKEYAGSKIAIGSISPGMVVTDMLLEPLRIEPEKNRKALKVFHILADPADRVAPWLVRRILDNQKHGVRIARLTKGKIFLRFFASMFKNRKVEGLPDF